MYIAMYCMMPFTPSAQPEYGSTSGSSARSESPATADLHVQILRILVGQRVHCRPLGGPDKIVIPVSSVFLFLNQVSTALELQ